MEAYVPSHAAIALAASIITLGLVIIRMVQRRMRLKAFAKLHGCYEPVYEESKFPINISKAREMAHHYQTRDLLSHFLALFHKLGDTYISRVLWLDIIVTCDPENTKQVLQRRFTDFDIGPLRSHLFSPITPHGIFNFDGGKWKHVRQIYRAQFSDTRFVVNLDVIEQCFQLLLRQIPKDGAPVDIQRLLIALVTDILGTYAVGEPLGALSNGQGAENKEVEEAYRFVKDRIARFGQSGPASWLYDRSEFRKASTLIQNYTERFVRQAMEKHHQYSKADGPEYQSATTFVEKAATDGYTFAEVRDQAISIYLAGIDSVSGLLSATCWYLSRDPRVFHLLQASIIEKFGHDAPPYEELTSVVYLRHVFNEALRLKPSVPFNAKVANKDTWLPRGGGPDGQSGLLVRKNQIVSFWPWATHRKSEIFGDNPEAFRPERWETIRADVPGFVPFQPGPRVCPGQRVALAMASYIIIRILQNCSSMESRDTMPWTESLGLSLASKHGVIVAILREK
ncbi:putative cytochrome P450 oxidoreductase/alkane hydroxylase [Hypoxylon crocopeplum]|nr:putative cytochrome P450 oxidoreductase/alkane hydroxylase [Hypoxylon crocopeplum]